MQLLLSWVSGIALLLVCALTTVSSIRGSTSQASVQTGALQEETMQETAAKGNGGNAEGNIGQDRVCLMLLVIVVLFLWQEYDLHRFFAARTGFDKPGKRQNWAETKIHNAQLLYAAVFLCPHRICPPPGNTQKTWLHLSYYNCGEKRWLSNKRRGVQKNKKIRSHCRHNCINILHQKKDEKGKKNPPLAFFCVPAGTGNGLPGQAGHKSNGKRACTYGNREGDNGTHLPKGRGTRVCLPDLRGKIQNWKNRQKRT